ncbi:MAG: hypothetical protein ACWGQW_00735 [bacterium]
MKTIKGKWIDELVHNVGQFIRLETSDGIDREGRLSGLKSRSIKWNGEEVEIITELELNGDPYDSVPLDRISELELI